MPIAGLFRKPFRAHAPLLRRIQSLCHTQTPFNWRGWSDPRDRATVDPPLGHTWWPRVEPWVGVADPRVGDFSGHPF